MIDDQCGSTESHGDCRICGNENRTMTKQFWSPDDGWIVGALCPACIESHGSRQPQPDDFAYAKASDMAECETDLDPGPYL